MEYLKSALAVQVKEAKLLARKNRSRKNKLLLLCFLGILGATGIWYQVAPDNSPGLGARIALAIFLGFYLGEVLLRFRKKNSPDCEAKCPVCGYLWEIKEGRAVPLSEQMETWDRCPACGLLMGDEIIDLSIRHSAGKEGVL